MKKTEERPVGKRIQRLEEKRKQTRIEDIGQPCFQSK